jgi:hypothetical protein
VIELGAECFLDEMSAQSEEAGGIIFLSDKRGGVDLTEWPIRCYCTAHSISTGLPCVMQIPNWPHVHLILSCAKLNFRRVIRILTFGVIRRMSLLFLVSVRRVMSCADKLARVVVI